MGFLEAIAERGYEMDQRTNNVCQIRNKQDEKTDIVIFFYLHDKKILGCLRPKDLIYTLSDISEQYSVFNQMIEDVKHFANMAKYDIIDKEDEE